MLHPSYTDLMRTINSEVEEGDTPVVNSRYSIVLAAAKRARQLIAGAEPLVKGAAGKKPLSTAVQELYEQKVTILPEEEETLEKAEEAKEDSSPEASETENTDTTEE